jgi:GMP synthase-like glutamine amidotransferase
MEKRINIHCLLHVSFEGPGIIEQWILKNNHHLTFTRFYEGDMLPDASGIDMLIIMGGPMNVFDFHVFPWMQDEIDWVSAFIETKKPVLGICLGAQILAAALGVEVYPGKHKEIGWFNLQFLPALGDYKIWKDLPTVRKVFHWHGDTFPIPPGATRIASSQAFPNQGFIYNSNVVALQFHLEVTPQGIKALVENCRDELTAGTYIQTEKEILAEKRFFKPNQELLFPLLAYLCGQIS